MDLVFNDGEIDHEVVVTLTDTSATVAELAEALGVPGTDLFVGGRRLDPTGALTDGGVVRGCTLSPTPSTAAERSGMELAVIAGADAGWAVRLADGVHIVGRSSKADVTFDVETVSRRHCAIHVAGGMVSVEDVGSSGGTFVDGVAVAVNTLTALPPQALVEIGDVGFVVRPVADQDKSAATDPVRDSNPAGEIPFNRPPRGARPEPPPPVQAPKVPRAEHKAPFNWIAVLGPALIGLLLAVLSNPLFALLSLASAALAIVNWLDGRRRSGKAARANDRNFRAELASFDERLNKMAVTERRRRAVIRPDLAETLRRAALPSARLWERRVGHEDFLALVVGYGDLPWSPPVVYGDYETPVEELVDAVKARSVLRAAPVVVELSRQGPVGVVGHRPTALAVARSLLVQACVHHGPSDVQVIVAAGDGQAADWDWAKWLPHVRDLPAGDDRLLLAGVDSVNTYLSDRLKAAERAASTNDALDAPLIVAVVDGPDLTRGRDSQVRALLRDRRTRATAVVIAASADQLPEVCAAVVDVGGGDGETSVTWPAEGTQLTGVLSAGCSDATARGAARRVARFEDPEITVPGAGLPRSVRVTSLLGLSPPSADAVLESWSGYDSMVKRLARTDSLAKPPLPGVIGVSQYGPLAIDIVIDGPHGLVGGTTGSGKTELLRSFVLGLAARADARYLNMVFVDFKGGAGFEQLAELPHCVGLETNLDAERARRALDCLQAELDYRQRRLREAPEPVEELHRYWAVTDDPLPRLVVIIDEMAELIAALPDFSAALIRIGRIGRTLGVHLVMATQRPGSVVTADLKENTNWAVALRVREASNSTDLVGVPDAAAIPPKNAQGRAMLRVGGDQGPPPVMFQSALSSAAAGEEKSASMVVAPFVWGRNPAAPTASGTEGGASSAGDDGDLAQGGGTKPPTELQLVVAAIDEAHRRSGLGPARRPWTEPLPDVIHLDRLFRSDTAGAGAAMAGVVPLALADDLAGQVQRPIGWDTRAGNLLLVGVVGSGTTSAVNSIALSLTRTFRRQPIHIYVMDFGNGSLRVLEGLPGVGAVVGAGETERQVRLLGMLADTVAARKKGRDAAAPPTFLLVDSFGGLNSAADAEPVLLDLVGRVFAEGPDVGVMTAVTADRPNAVPFKMNELAAQKWVLRLAERADYVNFGLPRRDPQGMPPGRVVVAGRNLTAQIAFEADVEGAVRAAADEAKASPGGVVLKPPGVGVLPLSVDPLSLAATVKMAQDRWFLPVGVDYASLGTAGWTLYAGDHALVAGPARSGKTSFLRGLIAGIAKAQPSARLIALTGRPGSGLDDIRPLVTAGSVGELVELVQGAAGSDHPVLVLVDDAQAIDDFDGQIDQLLQQSGPNVRFVVAGRTDDLKSYGHWTQAVRKSRTGLLLKVGDSTDGDLFGGRLPYQRSYDSRPGRGYIVCDGDMAYVQAALG